MQKSTITPVKSRHSSKSPLTPKPHLKKPLKQHKQRKANRLHSTSRLFSSSLTTTPSPSESPNTELVSTPSAPIDPAAFKDVPLYMQDNPASLEFYHFSNPKWRKPDSQAYLSSKKDPFQAMLTHPAGQVLVSQWISNHISLHLQHVLKHPHNAIKTKAGNILIGYDLNSEYSKDVHANAIDDLPPTDPRHIDNKTKLIYSPHTANPDWDALTMANYGYVYFDPEVKPYREQKHEYNELLQKHLEWAKLCGVTQEEALAQELQHRAHEEQAGENPFNQFKQLSSSSSSSSLSSPSPSPSTPTPTPTSTPSSLTTTTSSSPLLLGERPKKTILEEIKEKEAEIPEYRPKFKNMTVPEQRQYLTTGLAKGAVATLYYAFTILARTTQIITPGGAKSLWQRWTEKFTAEQVAAKIYTLSRALAVVTIRGGRKAYKLADSTAQKKMPFVNRFIRRRVELVSGTLVATGTPILSTVQSTTKSAESVAKFVDEWIGTEYAHAPQFKKIKEFAKFNTLVELQPHPGLPPEPPKASPYDNIVPPGKLFQTVRPSRNHSVHDLLSVAEIHEHRLLLSYIDRLRNTSKKALGLCPDELNLPANLYETHINEKGMIEVPLQLQQTTVPELLLLSAASSDTVFEQAGLRKHPDVWVSKRILDKIPSPDLVDLAVQIKRIDPNWSAPRGLKLPKIDKHSSRPGGWTFGTILRYSITGFGLGLLVHEGIQIKSEIDHAMATFPDLTRDEIFEDYMKFYKLRIKYSFTGLVDRAWYGITGNHFFQQYAEDEAMGSGQIGVQSGRQVNREFTQEELESILKQIEAQMGQQQSKEADEQPQFTILTQEQADALMFFNQQQDILAHSRAAVSTAPLQ